MVTMYYDKGGKLALTHYCVFGNQPGMLLKSADAHTLKFDFDGTCGINPVKESHMHALCIRFDDADTITTGCKAIVDGKEMPEHATTLLSREQEVLQGSTVTCSIKRSTCTR